MQPAGFFAGYGIFKKYFSSHSEVSDVCPYMQRAA